ncbi:ATP-binding cassette domain-containing protein [Proteinivorax tanatarense]|uniref:ATP-binding cassette domain-containing protein n=1 Tax=Proteinivorax tanatarense TaxID=1260629 RepID=A0AAU7VKU1_9FIRM
MIELSLKNISKYYGAHQILSNISFELKTKERVGLIGANGTGKTTIFKIITGEEPQDSGEINKRKDLKIGCLRQIPVYPDGYTVEDVLNTSFAEHQKVQQKLNQLEHQMTSQSSSNLENTIRDYGKLQQTFEEMGGYQIELDINRICNGLNISRDLRQRKFNLLSGGEKTTTILAQLLLKQPDLLLLDEPSNHLDIESLEWLEEYLKQYEGTVCIISHDRYFLDQVVTRVIEVESGECNVYHGDYSYFMKEKERRLMEQFEQYQNQQKKIKAIEKTIKDLKDWGNRAENPKFHKRAASMQKRLDKMEKIEKVALEQRKVNLGFSDGGRSSNEVFVQRN